MSDRDWAANELTGPLRRRPDQRAQEESAVGEEAEERKSLIGPDKREFTGKRSLFFPCL